MSLTNAQSYAVINALKPYDVTFPPMSGEELSLVELGAWIHAGYIGAYSETPAYVFGRDVTWNLRNRYLSWTFIKDNLYNTWYIRNRNSDWSFLQT